VQHFNVRMCLALGGHHQVHSFLCSAGTPTVYHTHKAGRGLRSWAGLVPKLVCADDWGARLLLSIFVFVARHSHNIELEPEDLLDFEGVGVDFQQRGLLSSGVVLRH